jgi:hypothetical protein
MPRTKSNKAPCTISFKDQALADELREAGRRLGFPSLNLRQIAVYVIRDWLKTAKLTKRSASAR